MSNRVSREFPELAQWAYNYPSYGYNTFNSFTNAGAMQIYDETNTSMLVKNTSPYMVNALNWWTNKNSSSNLSLDYSHPVFGEPTLKFVANSANTTGYVKFRAATYPSSGMVQSKSLISIPGYFYVKTIDIQGNYSEPTMSVTISMMTDMTNGTPLTSWSMGTGSTPIFAYNNELAMGLTGRGQLTNYIQVEFDVKGNNATNTTCWFTMPKFYYIDGYTLLQNGKNVYMANGVGGVW